MLGKGYNIKLCFFTTVLNFTELIICAKMWQCRGISKLSKRNFMKRQLDDTVVHGDSKNVLKETDYRKRKKQVQRCHSA